MRAYPAAAAFLQVPGDVLLECKVIAIGALTDCEVTKEEPEGWGFGAATLSIADEFQIKPAHVDGVPQQGTIKVPLAFRPVEPFMPVQPPKLSQPLNDESLVLAERLLELLGEDARFTDFIRIVFGPLVDPASGSGPADDEVRQLALKEAVREWMVFRERRAEGLAAAYEEEDLEAVVAFFESKAGRAWIDQYRRWDEHTAQSLLASRDRVIAAVREVECAKRACPPPTPLHSGPPTTPTNDREPQEP